MAVYTNNKRLLPADFEWLPVSESNTTPPEVVSDVDVDFHIISLHVLIYCGEQVVVIKFHQLNV